MKRELPPEIREEVDRLRARIRSRIRRELSAAPAVVVVDPQAAGRWRWVAVLHEAFGGGPTTVHQASDAAMALSSPLRDVWLAVVCASTPGMPALCQRLAEDNPYVELLVLAEANDAIASVPLFRYVRWLSVGRENWVTAIATAARSTAMFREHLVEGLTSTELAGQVLDSYGPEAAAELGLFVGAVEQAPSARESRIGAIHEALRVSRTKAEAAKQLGVGRSTLYRWLERYAIDAPELTGEE